MDRYCIFSNHLPKVKDHAGYISFNALFANIDVVAIRLKGTYSGEVVLILFEGTKKIGWLYFGNVIPDKILPIIFADVPDRDMLEKYEADFKDRVEVVDSAKDNYLFLSDKEITEIKPNKNAKIFKQKRTATAEQGENHCKP